METVDSKLKCKSLTQAVVLGGKVDILREIENMNTEGGGGGGNKNKIKRPKNHAKFSRTQKINYFFNFPKTLKDYWLYPLYSVILIIHTGLTHVFKNKFQTTQNKLLRFLLNLICRSHIGAKHFKMLNLPVKQYVEQIMLFCLRSI